MNTVTGGAELAPKPKYKPTPLANLSNKSMEAKTLAILRVNPNACLGEFPSKPKAEAPPVAKYASKKDPGMATSSYLPSRTDPYKTGDGEFQNYGGRTGCMDFLKCPSHGTQT